VSTTGAPPAPVPLAGPPRRMPRLIPPDGPLSLDEHLARYGAVPFGTGRPPRGGVIAPLILEVERSGLTGRGGAGFPCGRKMRAVAQAGARGGPLGSQVGTVLVANGAESEPASSKDRMLLARAPHLVLDGMVLAAEAVGAARAYLCVHAGGGAPLRLLADAVTERERAGLNRVPIQVVTVSGGYVSSQETALVSFLNGNPPLPAFIPPLPSDKGVHRRPTLVQNVETLAHLALIARYGASWFRELGTAQAAGSLLVTVSGAIATPGVYEVSLGTPIGDLVQRAGGPAEPVQAILAGGYFGGWLPYPAAQRLALSDHELRPAGAALGPGVLVLLPASACGLAETCRVTSYLASQSAGQCGPCRNGLPALAEAVRQVAFGRPGDDLLRWTRQLADLVTGRGACRLPDGTAALVASGLRVFADDLRQHAEHGPCARAGRAPVLPAPGRQGPAS